MWANLLASDVLASGPLQVSVMPRLAGLTTVGAQITANGVTSPSQTITLNLSSPGIFTMSQTGSGQGAVLVAGAGTLAAASGSVPGINCQPVPESALVGRGNSLGYDRRAGRARDLLRPGTRSGWGLSDQRAGSS
jgi:uncharacterized protein (TIGR03437 family)